MKMELIFFRDAPDETASEWEAREYLNEAGQENE